MELRNAEIEIDNIVSSYNTLRHCNDEVRGLIPQISSITVNDSVDSICAQVGVIQSSSSSIISTAEKYTAAQALQILESMRERLQNLQFLMEKLRKRLNEKDPITGKSRYGAKTEAKVRELLHKNDTLVAFVLNETSRYDPDSSKSSNQNNGIMSFDSVLLTIRAFVSEEETTRLVQEQECRERQQADEARRLAEEQRVLEERRQLDEAQRLQALQHRESLAREARNVREAELQAQREATRRDQAWVAGIPNRKSIIGVNKQLQILLEATSTSPIERKTALSALQKLFSQIVSHPEEPKFRRIRRDHPKFLEDIGRHPGGKEILIAAGFTLAVLDEVPSFWSREPDIETDMDGWAEWFDLLKSTLQVIENELMKN